MVVTHGAPTGAAAGTAGGWAVTIGNFDGVHRGHRALLDRVVAAGRERNLGSCVLTFEPHPREFFAPAAAPARLCRLRDKLELMSAAGVGRVHVARFDARLAGLPAEAFVEDYLVGGLGTRWLLVGRDFRYGKGRVGDFPALERSASRRGFAVEAMADVQVDGERVSSSAVREALGQADFARAERLLGRRYSISGRVAHGEKLGRNLGCPTANIVLRRSPPLSGIYVVEVEVEEGGERRRGVASIGRRPTVNPTARPLLEVHLFDVDEDLYGKHLRVSFLAKLRDEKKYPDLEHLKRAIAADVAEARAYFQRHG
ncbi:MAG: bifunctional riboflavin kinase/FAD synthetase [Clostridia bacterium]